ncbi:MAG: hypothetical protein ACRDCQ_12890, partial [Aeromonas sobria]
MNYFHVNMPQRKLFFIIKSHNSSGQKMNFKHIGCMTLLLINGHTALANDALQEEKVPACDYHALVVNTLSTLNINATGNPQGMVQGD